MASWLARSRWATISATLVEQMPEYSIAWLLTVPVMLIDAVSWAAMAESSPVSRFQKLTVTWFTRSYSVGSVSCSKRQLLGERTGSVATS